MKIKTLICLTAFLAVSAVSACASDVPKDIRNYLMQQKQLPSIRPDGAVIYSSDIMYLPVFPAHLKKVKEIKTAQTYPKNKSMEDFPDLIVFNNNFGLLKVIKTKSGTLSIVQLPEYPEEIKTGVLPQDLMVPRGFSMPENLAGIIGSLYIPIEGSAKAAVKTGSFISAVKQPSKTEKKPDYDIKKNKVPAELKNKLFFVNNYKTEYLQVFSPELPAPLYSLRTSGVMRDVKPVLNGKYLLAASKDLKSIDVIDAAGEYTVKQIDLTAFPSEIAADDKREKAYVSSVEDQSIFIIDLKTLKVKEKIYLAGAPKRLCISPDGSKLAYMDIRTSNILVLDLENNYENKLITNYPNTSKIILDNNVMFLIARTEPKLRIVYFDILQSDKIVKTKKDIEREKIRNIEAKQEADEDISTDIIKGFDVPDWENSFLRYYASSIKDIETGIKPVDLYKSGNNVFVLCAEDNTVYKYDIKTGDLISTKLPVKGFSSSFNPVPASNIAVITNTADEKYALYDMEQAKVLQIIPSGGFINSAVILEKKNEQ